MNDAALAPVNGSLELAYEIRGAGPPVLLVAGTGYAGDTWPPRAVDVLAAKFSVITYDHRGTGGSTAPPGPYSTRELARDALALLHMTVGEEPVNVVGHSMGGRVAQWMALDGPERVRSLVLAASGAGAKSGDGQARQGIPPATVLGLVELGYQGYVRGLQRRTFFTARCAEEHPEAVEWLAKTFWANRPELAHYLEHVAARQNHDTVDMLGAITCPTLVLVGTLDTHAGGTGSHLEQSRYLAEHIAGAELHLLEDVAHGFFWEQPERSMAVVREWIGRHSLQTT